ncbi:hypothetical protein BH09PAT4_BH09PAT4_02290 [soil metagenome]
MTKEQRGSPEQSENELLGAIVNDGRAIATRLQHQFGEVFYPMKFVDLPQGRIAYSNPGGNHPLSVRMHQLVSGQTAGVEVSLFFMPVQGAEGQTLRFFEDEQNRSNISDSSLAGHTYYYIEQNPGSTLSTTPGTNSPDLDIQKLQAYGAFVAELSESLDLTIQ